MARLATAYNMPYSPSLAEELSGLRQAEATSGRAFTPRERSAAIYGIRKAQAEKDVEGARLSYANTIEQQKMNIWEALNRRELELKEEAAKGSKLGGAVDIASSLVQTYGLGKEAGLWGAAKPVAEKTVTGAGTGLAGVGTPVGSATVPATTTAPAASLAGGTVATAGTTAPVATSGTNAGLTSTGQTLATTKTEPVASGGESVLGVAGAGYAGWQLGGMGGGWANRAVKKEGEGGEKTTSAFLGSHIGSVMGSILGLITSGPYGAVVGGIAGGVKGGLSGGGK